MATIRRKDQDRGHPQVVPHQEADRGLPWKVLHLDPCHQGALPGLLLSPTGHDHRDLSKASRGKGLSQGNKDKGKGPFWVNLDLERDPETKTPQQVSS